MSRFGFNRIKFVLPINLQANDHDSREEERERERERESFIQQALLLVAYETISRFVSYKFKTICIYLVILYGG